MSVVEAHKKTVNPMCHSSQNKRLIVDNNNIEKVTTNNNLGNLFHELNSNDSMQTIDVGWDGWITSGIISEQIVVSDDLQIEKKTKVTEMYFQTWMAEGGQHFYLPSLPNELKKLWKWKRAPHARFIGSAGN